jgi:hypothetical protein
MKKFDIKKMTDLHKLAISYLAAIVIFQIVFFMENTINVIKTVSVLFWVLVLPGLGITYLWKMGFLERFALSVAVSAALMGIASYYFGLAGISATTSSVVLPVIFMAAGCLIVFRDRIIRLKIGKKKE